MKDIIVTFGPSLKDKGTLKAFESSQHIFRINGSHGTIDSISNDIDYLREVLDVPRILVDLPGNKLRLTNLDNAIKISKLQPFSLPYKYFNFSENQDLFPEKGIVLADDSTLKFEILGKNKGSIELLPLQDGILKPSKGVHFDGLSEKLPILFEKDKQIIALANSKKVTYLGLSFIRHQEDIFSVRKLISDEIQTIVKVETRLAVENLNEILEVSENILIDRGDLSADIGLLNIPMTQKMIIDKAIFFNRKVYLATQFLKYMESKSIPTIAEVNDLYHTLKMGIAGIQLSEETAVGNYPKKCVELIQSIMSQIAKEKSSLSMSQMSNV